jgi:hypothetical protein
MLLHVATIFHLQFQKYYKSICLSSVCLSVLDLSLIVNGAKEERRNFFFVVLIETADVHSLAVEAKLKNVFAPSK